MTSSAGVSAQSDHHAVFGRGWNLRLRMRWETSRARSSGRPVITSVCGIRILAASTYALDQSGTKEIKDKRQRGKEVMMTIIEKSKKKTEPRLSLSCSPSSKERRVKLLTLTHVLLCPAFDARFNKSDYDGHDTRKNTQYNRNTRRPGKQTPKEARLFKRPSKILLTQSYPTDQPRCPPTRQSSGNAAADVGHRRTARGYRS